MWRWHCAASAPPPSNHHSHQALSSRLTQPPETLPSAPTGPLTDNTRCALGTQAKGPEAQRHALAVAAILADVGMDHDTIAVGLLDGAVAEGLLSLSEVAPVMGMQV